MLPEGNLAVVIADVCGKGVGAALFMTLFRSLIRSATIPDHFAREKNRPISSPSKRLLQAILLTNDYVFETHGDTSMFATVFFGILEPATGNFTYINGGNEAPVLVRKNGTLTLLDPTGPVVGAMANAEFSLKEVSIEKGDTLVAFTDGIPDCKSKEDKFFGKERLFPLLQSRDTTTARLLDKIGGQLQEFTGDSEQFDDITLLAVKRQD
jgi:serine phosphatase RsbU (regulator of sigma subunit)